MNICGHSWSIIVTLIDETKQEKTHTLQSSDSLRIQMLCDHKQNIKRQIRQCPRIRTRQCRKLRSRTAALIDGSCQQRQCIRMTPRPFVQRDVCHLGELLEARLGADHRVEYMLVDGGGYVCCMCVCVETEPTDLSVPKCRCVRDLRG